VSVAEVVLGSVGVVSLAVLARASEANDKAGRSVNRARILMYWFSDVEIRSALVRQG
jgi:hypothetical protein